MIRTIHSHVTNHRRKIIAALVLGFITFGAYIAYYRYFGTLPQSTYYLFQDAPAPTAQDRIVVFSPHQDDETLGTGGYIAAARDVGATVTIIFATDGNHHGLKDRRHAEAVTAAQTLGVDEAHLQFYDFPDTELKFNEKNLHTLIATSLNTLKPTRVFVTDPVDTHPDHASLGRVVMDETKKIASPDLHVLTYIIHYKEYPRPQQYKPQDFLLPPVALIAPERQWLKFGLNQQDFDKKNEAIFQYKSQLRTPFLHALMLSFARQNEIFSQETP